MSEGIVVESRMSPMSPTLFDMLGAAANVATIVGFVLYLLHK